MIEKWHSDLLDPNKKNGKNIYNKNYIFLEEKKKEK